MTDIRQMNEDLRFVREVVTRRDAPARRPVLIYWVWAVYVLVGYTLIDLSPRTAGWFFLVGGVLGGVASALIARRAAREAGEYDRAEARRSLLHWACGGILAVATPFALAAVIPALRGPAGGQLIAVNFGLVYFLAGVHFDRNFLWLGLVLIAGGVLVGLAPRYGWTTLGVIIALGLVVPTLFPQRRAPAPPQQPLSA
jgi:hypothetical protein